MHRQHAHASRARMHLTHAHALHARMRTPHGHAWHACHAQPACTYFLLVKYSTPSAINATMVMKLMGNSTNADAAMMSFMMCFLCRLWGPFGPPCDSRLGVCVLSNQLETIHFQGADFGRTSEGARPLGCGEDVLRTSAARLSLNQDAFKRLELTVVIHAII